MKLIHTFLAVAALAAGALSAAGRPAAAGSVPTGGVPPSNSPICGANAFVRVKMAASEFAVHDSAGTCVRSMMHRPGFQVSSIPRRVPWQYPNISSGYELGESSCASARDTCYRYPVRQRDDGMPVASVRAWLAAGTYNLSFDAWFAPKASQLAYGDRRGDTELMIWLAHPGIDDSAHYSWYADIDGTRWGVMTWWAGGNVGKQWRYMAYVAPRTALGQFSRSRLWLNPFFRDAEAHGDLRPSEWLTGIDLGFELYSGGRYDNIHGYTLTGVR